MSLNSTLIFDPSRDIEESAQVMINNNYQTIQKPQSVAVVTPEQYAYALAQSQRPVISQIPNESEQVEDDINGDYGEKNFNWKTPRFANITFF